MAIQSTQRYEQRSLTQLVGNLTKKEFCSQFYEWEHKQNVHKPTQSIMAINNRGKWKFSGDSVSNSINLY